MYIYGYMYIPYSNMYIYMNNIDNIYICIYRYIIYIYIYIFTNLSVNVIVRLAYPWSRDAIVRLPHA